MNKATGSLSPIPKPSNGSVWLPSKEMRMHNAFLASAMKMVKVSLSPIPKRLNGISKLLNKD